MAVAQPPVYVSLSTHCDLLSLMYIPDGPPNGLPVVSPYSAVSEAGIEGRAMEYASVVGVPVAGGRGGGGGSDTADDAVAARIVVRSPHVDHLFPVIGQWRRDRDANLLATSAVHAAQAMFRRRFQRSNAVVPASHSPPQDPEGALEEDVAGRPLKRSREDNDRDDNEGKQTDGIIMPAHEGSLREPWVADNVQEGVDDDNANTAIVTIATVRSMLVSTLLALEDVRVSPYVNFLLLQYSLRGLPQAAAVGRGAEKGAIRFLLGWRRPAEGTATTNKKKTSSHTTDGSSTYLSMLVDPDGNIKVEERRRAASATHTDAVHYASPSAIDGSSSLVDSVSKQLLFTDCLVPMQRVAQVGGGPAADPSTDVPAADGTCNGGGMPTVGIRKPNGDRKDTAEVVAAAGRGCVVDVLSKLAIALWFDDFFGTVMARTAASDACTKQWSVVAASVVADVAAATSQQEVPPLENGGGSGGGNKAPSALRAVSCTLSIDSATVAAIEVQILVRRVTLRGLAVADDAGTIWWEATAHSVGGAGRSKEGKDSNSVKHGHTLDSLRDELLRIATNQRE